MFFKLKNQILSRYWQRFFLMDLNISYYKRMLDGSIQHIISWDIGLIQPDIPANSTLRLRGFDRPHGQLAFA